MGAAIVGADTTLRRPPGVLAEEVGGTTVVLDPVADRYARLNATGGRLFAMLAEAPATARRLAAALAASAGIDEERALADVLAFAEDLVARGLLQVEG
jgi:hypothetical protein